MASSTKIEMLMLDLTAGIEQLTDVIRELKSELAETAHEVSELARAQDRRFESLRAVVEENREMLERVPIEVRKLLDLETASEIRRREYEERRRAFDATMPIVPIQQSRPQSVAVAAEPDAVLGPGAAPLIKKMAVKAWPYIPWVLGAAATAFARWWSLHVR